MKNKYNLTMKKINQLVVLDESKLKEPVFWRNNVINAWCISKEIGSKSDIMWGTNKEFWLGVYDKPYYGHRVRCYCRSLGGMCSYEFNTFFRKKDIKNNIDRKTQEELLKVVEKLLDDGILCFSNDKEIQKQSKIYESVHDFRRENGK